MGQNEHVNEHAQQEIGRGLLLQTADMDKSFFLKKQQKKKNTTYTHLTLQFRDQLRRNPTQVKSRKVKLNFLKLVNGP